MLRRLFRGNGRAAALEPQDTELAEAQLAVADAQLALARADARLAAAYNALPADLAAQVAAPKGLLADADVEQAQLRRARGEKASNTQAWPGRQGA